MKRSARQIVVENEGLLATVDRGLDVKDSDALIEWKDLLEWQIDNEYILTGYRQASYSIFRSAQSILRRHNETVNIWSHLLGALLFLVFLIYSTLQFVPQHTVAADGLILAIFFSGVVICFVLSTIFHVCSNHSKEGHKMGNQLDHLGIVIVIWGSAIPSVYFGFYCDLKLKYFYWFLATLAAVSCGIFTMRPVFRTPTYRPIRSAAYGILGVSIFIPAVHGVMLHGWAVQNKRMSLAYFIGLGVLNGTGTAIYAARIPEKWYPRRFDIYGSSHQIMHVLVICGALSHTYGLVKAFDYWESLQSQKGGACMI